MPNCFRSEAWPGTKKVADLLQKRGRRQVSTQPHRRPSSSQASLEFIGVPRAELHEKKWFWWGHYETTAIERARLLTSVPSWKRPYQALHDCDLAPLVLLHVRRSFPQSIV